MKEWTLAQAEALRARLEPPAGEKGVLGYCELAGFLFALACAPRLVMPSEWIPRILEDRKLESREEAQALIELIMSLYNRVNLEVLERKPALPAGIEVHHAPMENFGPQAALGQWAAGYGAGQLWLEEIWEACLREEPDAPAVEQALGAFNAALSFFASRELAEKWRSKMADAPPLEEAARLVLAGFPAAMAALADIGRSMDEARDARAREPVRRQKVGRNQPCLCGSGKKFKHCCAVA